MKKKAVVLLVLAGLLGWAAVSCGALKERYDPGSRTLRPLTMANVQAGRRIFDETCKTCHQRHNREGAPFLYAEKKTRRGWSRVFYERYPACAKNGSWDGLAPEELRKLNDYLYANAANASDPGQFLCE